jgi:hypothetical protein
VKIMPWTTGPNRFANDTTRRRFPFRWDCAVKNCNHGGPSTSEEGAELIASRHSATHTETEIASTGYVVRFNYVAAAMERLAR